MNVRATRASPSWYVGEFIRSLSCSAALCPRIPSGLRSEGYQRESVDRLIELGRLPCTSLYHLLVLSIPRILALFARIGASISGSGDTPHQLTPCAVNPKHQPRPRARHPGTSYRS